MILAHSPLRFSSENAGGFARLDRLKPGQTRGYEREKIFERYRFRAKNDNGDLPASEVQLKRDAAIRCQQDLKAGRFGFLEEFAICESAEASIPRGLGLMPDQILSQPVIDALVEQDPHRKNSGLWLGARDGRVGQEVSSLFEGGDRHFTTDAGKPFQEFFQRFSGFERIE
jgi:hypothetical protein